MIYRGLHEHLSGTYGHCGFKLRLINLQICCHCRVEQQINRIVRSLEGPNHQRHLQEVKHQQRQEDLVTHHYPWAVRNNSLPNYFLHAPSESRLSPYQRGAVVFLHHHRSAGTAMKECLNRIARNNSFAMSPVMGSDDRVDWEEHVSRDGANRNRFKLHRGQFTFGLCGVLQKDCSYFTILRDPMDRAVSSYQYCQHAFGDEMCKFSNANEMTLRQWILHQGSLLFQQLLFRPQWCQQAAGNGTKRERYESVVDPDKVPCWIRHKTQLAGIPESHTTNLVGYIVNNLDRWFAAIGLFEELENSLKLFEHIYRLPFTKCTNFKNTNKDAEIFDNRSNRKKSRDGFYDDNDPEYLKYDYEVQQALAPDRRIYKEAKKIFRLQRQMFFNKLTR